MSDKSIIYTCLFLGSTVGSLIPEIFGADIFSMWSIFLSAVGGILGILIGIESLTKNFHL